MCVVRTLLIRTLLRPSSSSILCLQSSARDATMAAIQQGVTLRQTPRPAEREGSAFSVHDQAMESIKRGVTLRSRPRPPERRPGEEKVVDFASELRQKMMKHRKNEVDQTQIQTLTYHTPSPSPHIQAQEATEKVEEQREMIRKMADALYVREGSPSFIHQLKSLLQQVDDFLRKVNVSLVI